MTYDPLTYWSDRGRTYEAAFRAGRYREQEDALTSLLAGLEWGSVLDVGCGFGRMHSVLERVRPMYGGRQPEPDLWTYTGIDLSPTMLASATDRLPNVELVQSSLEDFQPTGAWRLRRYDLVIAAEVLMHIPPADVRAAVGKLRRLTARHLVTVDWDAPGAESGGYQWGHDYARLLPGAERFPVGRQAIWYWQP